MSREMTYAEMAEHARLKALAEHLEAMAHEAEAKAHDIEAVTGEAYLRFAANSRGFALSCRSRSDRWTAEYLKYLAESEKEKAA